MFNPLIPRASGNGFHGQVARARAALDCPAIKEVLEVPLNLRAVGGGFTGQGARTPQRISPAVGEAYRIRYGADILAEVRPVRRNERDREAS